DAAGSEQGSECATPNLLPTGSIRKPGKVGVLPGCSGEVMVRHELRKLVGAVSGNRLDPGADLGVRSGSAGLGKAGIGNVPDPGVLEHVFRLAGERRRRADEDKTLALEIEKRRGDVLAGLL